MIFNITPFNFVGNVNAVGEPSRTEQLKSIKKKKKKAKPSKKKKSKAASKKKVNKKKK